MREQAVIALGKIASEHITGFLKNMLKDPERSIQRAAAACLARHGHTAGLARISSAAGSDDEQTRIWALSLAHLLPHDAALVAVRKGMSDRYASVRRAAVYSAALIRGNEKLDLLKTVLENGHADERAAAVSALGFMPGRKAEALVEQAVGDSRISVAKKAVMALGRRGSPGAVRVLGNLAERVHSGVAQTAVAAAGTAGGEAAWEIIERAASSPDDQIRTAAVQQASSTGHERACMLLARMLRDRNKDIRREALTGLCKKQSLYARLLLKDFFRGNAARSDTVIADALGPYLTGPGSCSLSGPGAVIVLRQAFQSGDRNRRYKAASAAADMRGWPALELLSPAVLEDPEESVRAHAVRSLAGLGYRSCGFMADIYSRALQDTNHAVRHEAVRWLLASSLKGNRDSQACLKSVLENPGLREILFAEIGSRHGKETLAAAGQAIQDSDQNPVQAIIDTVHKAKSGEGSAEKKDVPLHCSDSKGPGPGKTGKPAETGKLMTKAEFRNMYRRTKVREKQPSESERIRNEYKTLDARELAEEASADSKNWPRKRKALEELAARIKDGDRDACEVYGTLLTAGDEYCRSWGLIILGREGGDPALPLIEKGLTSENEQDRFRAVTCLRAKTDGVRDLLIRYIKKETDQKIRKIAVNQLESMFKDDPAAQAFLKTLSPPEPKPGKDDARKNTGTDMPEENNTEDDIF